MMKATNEPDFEAKTSQYQVRELLVWVGRTKTVHMLLLCGYVHQFWLSWET